MNNDAIYNAALAGGGGGVNERWIVSQNSSDYASIASEVDDFARAVDSAIPAGNFSTAETALIQSLCQGVLAGRYLGSESTPAQLVDIGRAIAAEFQRFRLILQPAAAYGTQTAWAINPATGSDLGPGTPAAPLATMAEFNRRWTNLLYSVVGTLDIVGSVTDQPLMLNGTRLLLNASLAVRGTRTQVFTGGTISVVTALGGNPLGASYPWQITTAGIDWTTVAAGSQIRFSNSTVSFIIQVIDANNVIVEPSTVAGLITIPTIALTFSVETLPNVSPPYITAQTVSAGATTFAAITITDVSFNNGGCVIIGAGCSLIWCEIKSVSQQWEMAALMRWIGCRASIATGGLFRIRAAPSQFVPQISMFVGAAGASPGFVAQGGQTQFISCTFQNCRFSAIDKGYCQVSSGMHIRNASSLPFSIDGDASVTVLNSINGSINGGGGGAGGTNVGNAITVTAGRLVYNGVAAKPSLTATAAADVRLGGTGGPTYTYAAVGTGKIYATVDGIPPALTTTDLIRTGTASFGEG